MGSRFEAEKFTGKNDFGLWRMKMKAMLIQQGLSEALAPAKKGDEAEVLDEKAKAKRAEILAKSTQRGCSMSRRQSVARSCEGNDCGWDLGEARESIHDKVPCQPIIHETETLFLEILGR